MTAPCTATLRWRRVTLRGGVIMRLTNQAATSGNFYRSFYVGRNVEDVIAHQVPGGWRVPMNNATWAAGDNDVLGSEFSEGVHSSWKDANDHNTALFCCRECGDWLESWHDGYGTEHGWCGCERSE